MKVVNTILTPISLIDRNLGNVARTVLLTAVGTAVGGPIGGALGATIGNALAATIGKGPVPVPAAQEQRLTASIDPRAFRKEPLGQTAFPIDVRYEEWSGSAQDYCDWIVCFGSCAIDGLEEFWLNDELAWSQTTGVAAKFAGWFSIPNIVLEGSPATSFTFASGKWNGAHRLTGCAYARLRFKVTKTGKKDSPFASGVPTRITAIGRGAKVYDPRRDSTVPGGAGPMRADDQSTWRFTADDGGVIGENLPLLVLRRLLGWRITNPVTGEKRLATGSGLPARRLDLGSWIVAANQADELVNRSAGGQEARYHGAGVASEGDDPKMTYDALLAGCCGRLRDTGGRLSIVIPHNDLAALATDDGLVTDDVIGGFSWNPDPALDAVPNVVRGRYVDASSASLYQLIDYPEVRVASIDGIDRILQLDLGYVESPSQAQRIAKQVLQRKQLERTFSAPFDIRAWRWPVGRAVPFTFAPLALDRAPFRVGEQTYGQGGSCTMVLAAESPLIYAWDADDRAPVQAQTAIGYDPTRSALLQSIADAMTRAAHQIVGQDVAYPVTTTDSSIVVEAFRGILDDGRAIDFPAGQMDGLENAANYRLFYALEDVEQLLVGAGGEPLTGPEGGLFTVIPAGSYHAVPLPAFVELANAAFAVVQRATTAAPDGTYPAGETPPGGYGGGGYGGGGEFVTAETAQ